MSIATDIQAELLTVLSKHNPPTQAQAFSYVELLLEDKLLQLADQKQLDGFKDPLTQTNVFPTEVVANSVTAGDFAVVYAFKDEAGQVQHAHLLVRILPSDNGSFRFKRLDAWTGDSLPEVKLPEVDRYVEILGVMEKKGIDTSLTQVAEKAVEPTPEQPKRGKNRGRRNEPEAAVRTLELRPEEAAGVVESAPIGTATNEESVAKPISWDTPGYEAPRYLEPSTEEVADVKELFDQAAADPDGSVTVTRSEEPVGGEGLTNDEPEQTK